ncbi:MAG: hypothetical protein NTY45_09740 [Elusimicrobia bacterium]|nr:hypothetical protein [Elusimicrobiota bacterium]
MGTLFSDTLVRLRKEAGFQTAYRFYHDNGGGPVLKMSYRNYLMMEQGTSLPVINKLQKLYPALRLPQTTPAARELIVAWLRTMAGEEVYKEILEPIIPAKTEAAGLSPVHKALQRTLAENKYFLTPAQFRAMLCSFETYKCSLTMGNDTGVWSVAEIAKALRVKTPAAEKSLKELAKAKLVKEVKKGFYKSRVAGQMVGYPNMSALEPELRGKFTGYLKKLEQTGSCEWASKGIIRADALALRGLFPLIGANIEAAQTYAVTKKTERSAFFYVIGKVVRLWDF